MNGDENNEWIVLLLLLVLSFLSVPLLLLLALYLGQKQPSNNPKIAHVGKLIRSGANVFLKKK